MNSGKTIFSQLIDFLSPYEFQQCVQRYNGNHKIKSFSCWDQFLCMAFAQLTYRESLRDIQACLRATQTKLYHLGIRGRVSCNTLANANQVRDWRIYADFAQILIAKARKLYASDPFGVELDPQLIRFRNTLSPAESIASYLRGVFNESCRRGYCFDAAKIASTGNAESIIVTRGQLDYEWAHLKRKLHARAPSWLGKIQTIQRPVPHPLFRIVPGKVEDWEVR
jgi:hypothetical protein